MPTASNLDLTSTSAAMFRATGQAAHLRGWLRERRPDMTNEAIRQVTHYAARLIDALGANAPSTVRDGPADRPERIAANGGERRRDIERHLERAGAALYAAIHDLSRETTQELMDRRPPRRDDQRQPANTAEDPKQVADLFQTMDGDAPDGGAGATASEATASLPVEARCVVEAINHNLTAQLQLDDDVDVGAVTRRVLASLSPAARVRVAAGLPHAAGLPVTTGHTKAANTLTELAEAAIVALMEQRYADLRDG